MKIPSKTKLSRHCVGTLVTRSPKILLDGNSCLESVKQILQQENTKCLGEFLHIFPNNSFSVVVVLAESHISIHTWPERHAVQLDVFLCNYINDNTQKCQSIFDKIVDYFSPIETEITLIDRL